MKEILILGNFFGNKKDRPTSQAEVLLEVLVENGYKAKGSSKYIFPLPRFIDQVWTLLLCRLKNYKSVIIEFYGSRAFYLQVLHVFLAKVLRYKVILDLHGGSIPKRFEQSPDLSRYCFKKADLIKAPSGYLQEFVESKGFECLLIENIIDLSQYPFSEKKHFRPRLLWMRAFQDAYDPFTALKAFRLFLDEVPDAHLTMAGGDLGQLEGTRRLSIELGLEQHVSFPGYIDHRQKMELAGECDVFLCTNKIDNTPVSMIEMMALGLLVVSTNPGGIPYLVEHQKTALLSEAGDANALGDNPKLVMQNQSLASEMTERAKEVAQRFDARQVGSKWCDTLKTLRATRS